MPTDPDVRTVITVPGDKSITHRALMFAALADGANRLRGLLRSEDTRTTAAVLRALGAAVPAPPPDAGEIIIQGLGLRGLRATAGAVDCGNSGTTARLLLGILAGRSFTSEITGDPS
ncbi:MAG: 3-phosphoshikimate 1-carboxyvinyltransferase, partial [Gemmatimonadetes bacterium]|nr:3-phosphoshikimate 1-carboxyvinyltransferase [Gemmatimonadota bacterium]NIQ52265.1 3-phosphoshikimate 1-carboxyvinyltransferase [Gemmatimonadota bacterium]NIU75989.1 3-phosphoshikimate 1-carboxyvinyltransferase [Gammaproteobacteria bacterium]NIX39373.1 3-phosphoshikimate 1-carboxyvinyltransferase [Gemmatimonadota bacterium]NIX46374.1 3-phosphoshikimate 1-carboxyvinyltransferase [Gemmatimonadota bacterium]